MASDNYLIEDVISAGVLHLNHYISVKEIRCNHIGYKWCIFFLEHNSHDVISYMPLPLELKLSHTKTTKL